MGWPLLIDSLNLLDVSAVPLTYLIDEAGIVRYERPSDEESRGLSRDGIIRTRPGQGRTLDVAEDSPEQALLWGGDVSAAISGLHRRVAAAPEDARAHFPLGVAYRKRYDSEARKPRGFREGGRALGAGSRARPEPVHLSPTYPAIRTPARQALSFL